MQNTETNTSKPREPKVCLVLSGPGGSGKTRVAMSVACVAEAIGLRTLVIETNALGGQDAASLLAELKGAAPGGHPYLPDTARSSEPPMAADPAVAAYDVVVVDAEPRVSSKLREAWLTAATLVLVPVRQYPSHALAASKIPKLWGLGPRATRYVRFGVGTSPERWTPLPSDQFAHLAQYIRRLDDLDDLTGPPGGYSGPDSTVANADAIAVGLEVTSLLGFTLPDRERAALLGWDLPRLDASLSAGPIPRPTISAYLR